MSPGSQPRSGPVPSSHGAKPTGSASSWPKRGAQGGEKDEKESGLRGKILGRYRLIEEIGHGGQGFVYRAEDLSGAQEVALKILPHGHLHSAAARLRFEREAEATGRLVHPGIARVIELNEHDGILFIAMELIQGVTLAQIITEAASDDPPSSFETARDPISKTSRSGSDQLRQSISSTSNAATASARERRGSLMNTVRYLESAARALHVAHEAGLVHRDIKPGNLMVRDDGSACVLDFGLAQDDVSASITLTQTGDFIGTPAYMSPEQLLAQRIKLDRRTDIYSLGICLFEACTLDRPFKGRSNQELYQAISQKEPTSPRKINPKIPRDLEAIILTAIDKDRDRRYQTAQDFADDLRSFLNFRPVEARPAGALVKSTRWVRRNRTIALASAIVFLALITTASVFYLKSEEASRSRDEAQVARERAEAETQAKTVALAAETREREAKELALDNYDRLADVKRLEAATLAAESLFPPGPDLIPRLRRWQERHGSLVERIESHRTFVESLRGLALPYDDLDRENDFRKEIAELNQLRSSLAERPRKADTEESAEEDEVAAMKEKIAALELLLAEGRRTWRFEDQALQFQHDVLSELVDQLREFKENEKGPTRSVARYLDLSEKIEKETIEEVADRWRSCQERIAANPAYSKLKMPPQLGLIPLGPDPNSGLEEFLHWLSHEGPVPERDPETGRIALDEKLGIILILVPSGSFMMGSQKDDELADNFDAQSEKDERPVHAINLGAYFFSKYEMNQAQWKRSFLSSPSQYGPGMGRDDDRFKAAVNARHPVESVSHIDLRQILPKIGLTLPTEAEWERAARAGRSDQVFAGTSEVSELHRFANISGAETKIVPFPNQQEGHEDDFLVHAPVGSFEANAFGFHDMTGNVWEWCLDCHGGDYEDPCSTRGERGDPEKSGTRVLRGGSFNYAAGLARIANRNNNPAEARFNNLGVRPVRLIEQD